MSTNGNNGHHPLKGVIKNLGGSMSKWTVMKAESDPFRMDTPANHRDAQWLVDAMAAKNISTLHDRGIHYRILGLPTPAGFTLKGIAFDTYPNTTESYAWLVSVIGAARWLDYIPWDRITDSKHRDFDVTEWLPADPDPYVGVNFDFDATVPDAADLAPRALVDGFVGDQPYKLVVVGEKSSLRELVSPVCQEVSADLYLPTGDISTTMAYHLARRCAEDGRPTVIRYIADSDPGGWNMMPTLARKLQAFKATQFPEFEFQIDRIGLTPEQVRDNNLPGMPLKIGESRADDWMRDTGTQQTEIDAMIADYPDLLTQWVRDSLSPFFDSTLARRVRAARAEWLQAAQAVVDAQDDEGVEALRENAAAALAEKIEEIQQVLNDIRIDADSFDLPDVEIPSEELDHDTLPQGACNSEWPMAEQITALKAARTYLGTGS